MRKSLFASVILTILFLSITTKYAMGQSANPAFRPPPTPTPVRPTPTPTPIPPSPTPTPAPTPSPTLLGNAINQRGLGSRVSPAIRAGGAANVIGSRSYTYSVPMFSLPGRHGLNLDLTLYYNSSLWDSGTSAEFGNVVSFISQLSAPSPGFQLDYGYISWATSEFSPPNAILIDSTGAKHVLVEDSTGTQFHTVDSSYITLVPDSADSTAVATYKNGMQVYYTVAPGSVVTCCPGAVGNSGSTFIMRPVKIEDTSGNFITINYFDSSTTNLSSVVDTVGRTITFVYNANSLLTCVTDGSTCNAAGSRTYNLSWNASYILNYQFTNVVGTGLVPIVPFQGSQFPYTVLTGITRPDGTRVSFNYGDWFIVNDIQELSINGTLRYESNYNFPLASAGALSDAPSYTQQTVTTFDKDGNPQQAKWLYQSTLTNTGLTRLVSCSAVTDPSGTNHVTLVSAKGDIFDGLPITETVGTGSTSPCTAPPTVLKTVTTQWTTDKNASGILTGENPHPQAVTTTLSDGITQSQAQYAYDVHGNATDIKEFDFGQHAPGGLLRETVATYSTSLGAIADRATDIQIKDGTGIISHQIFGYDNYSTTPLQSASSFPPGFDSTNFGPNSTSPRGNLTNSTIFTNAATASGPINSTFTYDIFGNRLTSQQGCCSIRSLSFSLATQFAYPDSVAAGSPTTQLASTFSYDMSNGHIVKAIDYNGESTVAAYDNDDRPLSITSPDGITSSYAYDDAGVLPTVTSSSTSNSLIQKTTRNAIGSPLLIQVLSGTSLVSTKAYVNDGLGRAIQVSNPYGPTDPVAYNQFTFDALGNLTSTTPPSTNQTTAQIGYKTTYSPTAYTDVAGNSHAGVALLVSDPAGHQTLQLHDALGRLVRVDEPGGQPLSLATPNSTYYSYSATGQLLSVVSGQQTRSYQYDGLGRVTQAVIPEAGYHPKNITYTDFGAPAQVIDPRVLPGTSTHIATTLLYDSPNRLSQVTYNDGTPSVTYTYGPPKAAGNTGGRILSVTNGVSTETYRYDSMGRKIFCQTVIAGQAYVTTYTYHPDGSLSSMTYPSGRVVAFGEDPLGRLNQIYNNGSLLFAVNAYNANNQIVNETYANGVIGLYSYNAQMQIISRNYSLLGTSLVDMDYSYGNTMNNGQIISITDNVAPSRSTSYAYDALGRIAIAGTDDLTSANTWQLQFTYDRYGNRLGEVPTGGTANMPFSQVLIDPTTNHIITQGYSYDDAGDMSSDGFNSYTFDALNEMTAVAPIGQSSPTATSSYDAYGRRVVKNDTVYIFSGKNVIAEYPFGAAPGAPTVENVYRVRRRLASISSGVVTFHFADHLSGRIDTDSTGNVTRSYGHYPFGETWYETGIPDKWKFTTYENDVESGLNYAGARFQSPRIGRYMSIDPLAGLKSNPQSLNRYAYVDNDPINATDLTGKVRDDYCDDFEDICDDGSDIEGGDEGGPRTPGGEDDGGGSIDFFSNNNGPGIPDSDLDRIFCGICPDGFVFPGMYLVQEEDPNEDIMEDLTKDDSERENEITLGPSKTLDDVLNTSLINAETTLGNKVFDWFTPGPLPDDIAETFAGGRYVEVEVGPEGWMLFNGRVAGGTSFEFGRRGTFYNPTPQVGGIQSLIDNALPPRFNNTAELIFSRYLEPGTTVYVGVSASQGDFFVGGNIQIYVPK